MSSLKFFGNEPITIDRLRRFAPFLLEGRREGVAPASLTLFGFSDAERELCLDAVDLCGADGAVVAVELRFGSFDEFIHPQQDVADGLALVRVPDDLDKELVTWLAIRMATLAGGHRLSVVPVLSMPSCRSELLPSIAPYCPTLLSTDSEVIDFATVISVFLRLPRASSAVQFICPECAGLRDHSVSHRLKTGFRQEQHGPDRRLGTTASAKDRRRDAEETTW